MWSAVAEINIQEKHEFDKYKKYAVAEINIQREAWICILTNIKNMQLQKSIFKEKHEFEFWQI